MKIVDRFGSRPGAELVRLPQGGEQLLAVEHAAALLVNEQTAFRVVCTPELLPQLALGRLLTEGWIASADEVEQVAVCAEGLKVSVHLTHPLAAAPAAGQEVPSCCTDNLTVASPVVLRPLAPVPQLEVPEAWVGTLAAAMGGELPLYRATRAVHSCGPPQCARQSRRLRTGGRSAAGGVRPLHQRPGAGGYGTQGHPRRCSRPRQQDDAHRSVGGAGGRIRIEAAHPKEERISRKNFVKVP